MVNDPEGAIKGTARFDRASFAYMTASDQNSPYSVPVQEEGGTLVLGRSTVHVLRGLQNLGNASRVGFLVSQRDYKFGGRGTILSGDSELRINRNFSWIGQGIVSYTKEPMLPNLKVDSVLYLADTVFDDGRYSVNLDGEKYWGTALITELRYRSRSLSFTIDYNQLTPTYRTQVGYDPWNDQKNMFAFANYTIRPESGLFDRITPNVYFDRRWDWDGERKWAHFSSSLGTNLRWAQTFVGVGYNRGSERWFGTEIDDLWNVNADFAIRPMAELGFNVHYQYGPTPFIQAGLRGNETNIRASFNVKPIDRLIVEPTLIYAKNVSTENSDDVYYDGYIARSRFRYQATRRLSIRMVVQYNDFNQRWEADPLLTYRLNPFSVFYVGATNDYDKYLKDLNGGTEYRTSSRQLFMKLQYLFQT
jgi:hypothetical protein